MAWSVLHLPVGATAPGAAALAAVGGGTIPRHVAGDQVRGGQLPELRRSLEAAVLAPGAAGMASGVISAIAPGADTGILDAIAAAGAFA